MAKTVVQNGQPVDASVFNAINSPQFSVAFGQEEYDGINHQIVDEWLDDRPTSLKPRVNTFFNEFRVTAGTGLSVNYLGGVAVLPGGARAAIAPGTIALPNNQACTIFIDTAGVIQVAASNALPVSRLELASLTTAAGAISGAIVDLRPRYMILPRVDAIKVFGGSGDQGDLTISGSTTLSEGEYWYRNLTVTASGVLTIPAACRIYVSGNVLIQGTINIGAPMLGGSAAVILPANSGVQIAGTGQGAARNFFAGGTYNYSLSSTGSGGATGSATGGATGWSVDIGAGGAGGGYLLIEAGGTITVASGATIAARGTNANAGTVTNGTNLSAVSGSGGGSGGLILLKSLNAITVAGTIDVRGGSGSNAIAAATGFRSIGGGGGGGGQTALLAPSINTTGSTILLSGGAAGTTINNGSNPTGGGGGGGFGGAGGGATDPSATAGSAGQLIVRTLRATV